MIPPSITSLALSVGLLLCSSLVGPTAAYIYGEINHNEQRLPATVTPLLRQKPAVNLRFQRRQDAAICPTGTTSCGSNCCAGNTNCWNNAACAPLGQCPAGAPVQCHDHVADPNGLNSNLFYCCPSGYFCAPAGQQNNCILSQTTTADVGTVTVAARTIITISQSALITPTSTPTSSSALDADSIANATQTKKTTPSLSSTTAAPTKKLPIGPIVGGTVGGIVFFAILAVALFCFLKRRKAKAPAANYNPKTATISSFGSPQPAFGSPQPGFGSPQSGFASPQPGLGSPRQGFGSPQEITVSPQPGFEGRGAPSPNPYISRQIDYAVMASPTLGSPRSPGFQSGSTPMGSPQSPGFHVGSTPMGSPRSPGFQVGSTPMGSPRSPGFQINASAPMGSPRSPGFQMSSTPMGSPRSPTFHIPPGSPQFPAGGTGPLPLGTQVQQAHGSSPNLPLAPYNPRDWASPSSPEPSSPPPSGAIVLSLPPRSASSPPDSPMTSGPPPGHDDEISPPAWSPPPPPPGPPPRPLVLPGRETPTQRVIAPIPIPVPFTLPEAPAFREGRPASYHENEAIPAAGTPVPEAPRPNETAAAATVDPDLESYYSNPDLV